MACAGIPVVTSRFIASLSSRKQEQAIAAVIKKALVLLARISLVPLLSAGLLWLFWPSTGDNTIYRNTALFALLVVACVDASLASSRYFPRQTMVWPGYVADTSPSTCNDSHARAGMLGDST